MTDQSIKNEEEHDLPDTLKAELEQLTAVLPSQLGEDEFVRYLQARDEKIIKEKLVKVGQNGTTRYILVGKETSQEDRKNLNFPRYKMKIRLRDIMGPKKS